eukprot:CAMPEP_0181210360 /NCGR_PEP_ID=MMETSP1096-20121128/23185_1 /TAXON_ID=156174 ORGANISM="Chrysochromulina ericina, Strain CCMP281" /NCGR_SAMPLE_ID=MMETSP1096 /ASSEMBLY_ACC=CAM_ASM_000453 /LENGTH=39 /DNA_ID= /DNA_START= /DNA_END= /DNA_ORIENTATION=
MNNPNACKTSEQRNGGAEVRTFSGAAAHVTVTVTKSAAQ